MLSGIADDEGAATAVARGGEPGVAEPCAAGVPDDDPARLPPTRPIARRTKISRRDLSGAFNEQLQADGHWVFAGGLGSPSASTVVDGRDGQPVFTDGPYLESKEFIIGFWIVEAPHLDVALRG